MMYLVSWQKSDPHVVLTCQINIVTYLLLELYYVNLIFLSFNAKLPDPFLFCDRSGCVASNHLSDLFWCILPPVRQQLFSVS